MFDGVAKQLQSAGSVGVIATDTVYGLVARAADALAVARLYRLKAREAKPGTIIAASFDQLEALGLKRRYLTAVSQFWPGSVSVIIPCGESLQYLHDGAFSLAVRIPKPIELRNLLTETGPLLTSSANQPGEPTAVNLAEAQKYFGDSVDFYIDGGDLSNHQPSTIIRVVDDEIKILRQGAVTIKQ